MGSGADGTDEVRLRLWPDAVPAISETAMTMKAVMFLFLFYFF